MSENYFKELAAVDCAEHIEKKGQFSYLSWAWAVHYVGVKYPDWSFNVKRFGENQTPYMKTELGFFVEVEVTISGSTKSEIMQVLNIDEDIDYFYKKQYFKACSAFKVPVKRNIEKMRLVIFDRSNKKHVKRKKEAENQAFIMK